jgi:primosomal protein N' (replication factor Y)
MNIISVIPLKKGVFKGDLTYFSSLDISTGDVVSVPIKNRKILALVTSVKELKEWKGNVKEMDFNLRKVTETKGRSIFRKEFLDAASDTTKYFAQNKNMTIVSLIPNIFIEEYDRLSLISPKNEYTTESTSNVRTEKLLLQCGEEDRISTYKTLVRESFARGKSIFLVLPTEFDIEKYTNLLCKGIEQFTFSLHSNMSMKKNLVTYEKIISSSHPVLIIATPPFLSIPKNDIGTIILESENSNAYRTIRRPHVDLRIFVEIYASKINAKFILADDILRFETIARKELDGFNPLHSMSYRIDFAGDTEIENPRIPTFQMFSQKTKEEIKNTLENKKNVFIFSLRKGLATETLCRDCGETVSCKTCGAPLVLYLSHKGKKRIFVCNRCSEEKDGDTACESCGSWNLIPFGIGTDTVYEEIKKILKEEGLSKIKIFKLDKESAKTQKGAQNIVKEFEENKGAILIGTEMTFFYLKNKVPLSIIASFDSLWSIPNFKMSEKIIHIILSIAKNTTSKFIIQTKNDNDKSITAIKSLNLLSFIREELEDRKALGYPPFKRFIKITYLGDKEETQKARNLLEEIFKEYSVEIFSGFVGQMKEKYVTNALLKLELKNWSLPCLSIDSTIDEKLFTKLLNLPPSFEIFVDPEDLL